MSRRSTPVLSVTRVLGALALIAPAVVPLVALAQPALEADWVDEAQQRIAQHRMTDVRVIVLDAAGEPVQGADVRIEQRRHDFPLGFTLRADDEGTLSWPKALQVDDRAEKPFELSDAPVWRIFNAVAIDEATDWARTSPEPAAEAAPDFGEALGLVERAREPGLAVHFGGVVSADLGRNPGWLGDLPDEDGPALNAALNRRLHEALRRAPGGIHRFDLYTHALDHALIEDRLGLAALRHLFEHGQALAPGARLGVRFRNALIGPRRHAMVQRVLAMREGFVPFDTVAIDQQLSQPLVQPQLRRSLAQFDAMGLAVTLVGLEVGGESEAAAAHYAEIVLVTSFASPSVRGIWFGGLAPEHARVPHAALLDGDGEPTAPGHVVDRLFGQTWWTEHEQPTDALGNVRARVFAGIHRIEAVLPDGVTAAATVHVPRDDAERIVVLEP